MPAESLWSDIVTDLGDEMAHLVKEELVRGWNVDAVLAATRQAKIAEANARIEHCAIEGIGQHAMSVDADAYFSWQVMEPGCWSDKAFRDWFKKQHPETAVHYTPRATTIIRP